MSFAQQIQEVVSAIRGIEFALKLLAAVYCVSVVCRLWGLIK